MNVRLQRVAPRAVLTLVLAVLGVVGCDSRDRGIGQSGGDPIDALAENTVSPDYNEAYWGEQRRGDTEIWSRATAYCDGKDGIQYPNCRPVLTLLLYQRTLDRPRTVSPGFDGSLDMRDRADSARARLDSLP